MRGEIEYYPLGDSAIYIEFINRDDPLILHKLRTIIMAIEDDPFDGFIECALGFYGVAVYYDPAIVYERARTDALPYDLALNKIKRLLTKTSKNNRYEQRKVVIPVCYGGEHGPDLEYVANYHQLTAEEVIEKHAQGNYIVRMIGFAPGFPYLEGLNPQLATPRKDTPRLTIPAGSVGIGGSQTGIYPIESPGGWQLIGRSPIALFSVDKNPPSLLQSGDIVKFKPITSDEYARLKGEGHEY